MFFIGAAVSKFCVENSLGRIWFGNIVIFSVGIFEIPAREFLPPFLFFFLGTFLITPSGPTTQLF